MSFIALGLIIVVIITIALIVITLLKPSITADVGGKILIFFSFFILPIAAVAIGTSLQLENSKTTQFCQSCHVMEPYVKSLYVDSGDYIPASHFQNNRLPRESACYTCHTTYTMFGGLQGKIRGLRHLYVNYMGKVPEKIVLYSPYENRECLYCHDGARSFEENVIHTGIRDVLQANKISCLSCHNLVHNVDKLEGLKLWEKGEKK